MTTKTTYRYPGGAFFTPKKRPYRRVGFSSFSQIGVGHDLPEMRGLVYAELADVDTGAIVVSGTLAYCAQVIQEQGWILTMEKP